jgi:hypothetical protein
MHRKIMKALLALALIGAWAALPAVSHAQGFSSPEMERALRPGTYVPHDGAPFSHRYNFSTGPILYFNGQNARQMWYLEYLDREDRAERFGYRPPSDRLNWGPSYRRHSRF